MPTGMRVVITGGLGFIGRRVAATGDTTCSLSISLVLGRSIPKDCSARQRRSHLPTFSISGSGSNA